MTVTAAFALPAPPSLTSARVSAGQGSWADGIFQPSILCDLNSWWFCPYSIITGFYWTRLLDKRVLKMFQRVLWFSKKFFMPSLCSNNLNSLVIKINYLFLLPVRLWYFAPSPPPAPSHVHKCIRPPIFWLSLLVLSNNNASSSSNSSNIYWVVMICHIVLFHCGFVPGNFKRSFSLRID